MCGIVGYNIAGKSYKLESAIYAIRHRGPDGEGCIVLADGKVALGHTRLAIQDLSIAGAQPMTDENNDLAISYNGEIYNVSDLRSKLKRAGFSFFGRSKPLGMPSCHGSQWTGATHSRGGICSDRRGR